MILTVTIDTHPHSGALIEGHVKRALDDFLADRQLGVVVETNSSEDIDSLKADIDRNVAEVDRLHAALNAIEDRLEKAEISLIESNDAPGLQGLELVQECLAITKET